MSVAELPGALRAHAEAVGNGELLWPRAAALAFVEWAVDRHLGIVGGEVYERLGGAKASFRGDWTTMPGWSAGEVWSRYVKRGAAQAREMLGQAPDGDADALRYFIAVQAQPVANAGRQE